jgi:hypothetical protein
MIRQTNGSPTAPEKGVKRGMTDVARDLISLAELQSELLQVDAKEAAARAITPIILLVVGSTLALGTIPVVLLLIASALAAAGLSYWLSLLIAAIIGGAAAAGAAWAGWKKLRSPLDVFQRSREEFNRNVQWLKHTLSRRTPENTGDQ